MHDPELQASLDRINDRSMWVVGWALCTVVSLMAIFEIAMDWHLRGSLGKLAGGSLILFLLLFPTALILHKKRRGRVSSGWQLMMMYLLMMLTIQAFGPMSRGH